MKTYSVYTIADGLFTRRTVEAADDAHATGFLLPGEALVEGLFDRALHKVVGGEVVPREDADIPEDLSWVPAARARARRGALLASTDWLVVRAQEQGASVAAAWVAYRQALRDVPEQPGFPDTIDWPTPPAA